MTIAVIALFVVPILLAWLLVAIVRPRRRDAIPVWLLALTSPMTLFVVVLNYDERPGTSAACSVFIALAIWFLACAYGRSHKTR